MLNGLQIVYVGPQTREDAGHKGVYDVLVDGFKYVNTEASIILV